MSINNHLIEKIETKMIKNNPMLNLSVNEEDIERCKDMVTQYGLLTPPVVGSFSDGKKIILSGECEFLTLRTLGIKDIHAINIPVKEEETSKISLLISTLNKSPNAISEGLMVEKLVKDGQYSQYNLGKLLGKSKSWVSKRISLVTRLQPTVRELVSKKTLCPNSAQEIAKMPEDLQHDLAIKIIQENIPKSAVEILVSTYNNINSPESLKTQILKQPCDAINKIIKLKTVKTSRDKKIEKTKSTPQSLQNNLVLLLRCIKEAEQELPRTELNSLSEQKNLLENCQRQIKRFVFLIENSLNSLKVSPGKQN